MTKQLHIALMEQKKLEQQLEKKENELGI